jgi:RND family efflux transporter MFP subunit
VNEMSQLSTVDSIRRRSSDLGKRRHGALAVLSGVVLALALLIGYGVSGHERRQAAALETLEQQQDFVPEVRTIAISAVTAPRQLDLPGSTEAFNSATVFARATGYIAKRYVDIGTKVKEGDVLAVIAAPDLDQQLNQARAQLEQLRAAVTQANASANLAQATDKRTKTLVAQGWQTQQQGDVDRLTYKAQAAALRAAEVNVQTQQAVVARLENLTGYERIVAPFQGTINRRQIDVGSLVTADVSSGTPLFSIDRTDVLRVLVYVPQEYVFGVKDGEEAQVIVPEVPERIFKGKVARNAGSLDPATRTLQTEVDVDNSAEFLRAGLYCSVRFWVPRQSPIFIIPAQAVLFDKNGLSVAVEQKGVARVRHIELERDDGAEVEVRAGLYPGERVILNPPVGVHDGMPVKSAANQQQQTGAY